MALDAGTVALEGVKVLLAAAVGWLTATLKVDGKLQSHKSDLVAHITKTAAELRDELAELEAKLGQLEENSVSVRVQSASDEAKAAALAQRMEEVREQCQQSTDTLNRILGVLDAKGIPIGRR